MPLRVLRVIYDLQTGGVQRQLLRVAPCLRELGVELSVCCLHEEGDLAPVFAEAGIPVKVIPFRSRMDPMGLWRLRRHVASERFDVVHSHMYASNVATTAALWLTGTPIVNGYHSESPFANDHQSAWARWCARQRRVRLLAVSEAVRSGVIAGGVPNGAIVTVHNGISRPASAAPPISGEGPLRLVWIGRFVKQKRPQLALRIVQELIGRGVDVRLTFVGDGPQLESTQAECARLGLGEAVEFVGRQRDVRPFLHQGHLYLSTSDREGFANTLLEAFAEGRGAIATDIPPNREASGDSGAAALCQGEAGQWAGAIATLAADRSAIARMGAIAWERAGLFTVETTARKTLELYEGLLRG
ncbi:glycosyltransferase [bacterium]|nr:glycosyltransferase [bacterium]